jgi:hypothetical protein
MIPHHFGTVDCAPIILHPREENRYSDERAQDGMNVQPGLFMFVCLAVRVSITHGAKPK